MKEGGKGPLEKSKVKFQRVKKKQKIQSPKLSYKRVKEGIKETINSKSSKLSYKKTEKKGAENSKTLKSSSDEE